MEQVITNIGRRKILQARNGKPLPPIKGIALGSGAEDSNRKLISLDKTSSELRNEVIRKECVSWQVDSNCIRYRIVLEESELVNTKINEAALYDTDGDLLVINVFKGKRKAEMELAFEFDDKF